MVKMNVLRAYSTFIFFIRVHFYCCAFAKLMQPFYRAGETIFPPPPLPPIFADELILFLPWGQIMPTIIPLATRIFRPSDSSVL